MYKLIHGDCRDSGVQPESVGAVVTDPPYGLKFMGKEWDHSVPGKPYWENIMSLCKPGAHLLAFGGTKTHHRLMCAIEDAGWEIRDCLMWVYGSGFPKSLNIGKAIDKAAGVEREVVGTAKGAGSSKTERLVKNLAQNVPYAESLCDSCATRIALGLVETKTSGSRLAASHPILASIGSSNAYILSQNLASFVAIWENIDTIPTTESLSLLCGSVLRVIEKSTRPEKRAKVGADSDQGKATRFRYCAKAGKKERTHDGKVENKHPTVKPIKLMEYLINLIAVPGLPVFDPFMGSGSTGVACVNMGVDFIGCELESLSYDTAKQRLANA